ncbi:MAG: M23 family metallopeptidase [Rubrivivax sp.]|nr:M23 family metallopeptidase [Rubrivivax sp.]
MQLLITHGRLARTHALQFTRWQLALGVLALVATLLLLSGTVYHFVFLKAAREGWPVVSPLVRLIVRDELAQRERYMRDNLDAIAQRVGEMQAKLVKLEAMGERVQGLAGVKADELNPPHRPASGATLGALGRGGPFVPLPRPSLEQLQRLVTGLDEVADFHTDFFTLVESRLLASRLQALMVPSAAPVQGDVGSGFGFRRDPFNGRSALHTGLDFPAAVGTPITAAAGGIVTGRELHPEYGQLLEISHGNGLVTRYAHCASLEVPLGALVRRGQVVAQVGNSGRSTGAHLHFEVLVDGVPQDPARFLAGRPVPQATAAAAPRRR